MKLKAPIVESLILEDNYLTNDEEAMKIIVRNYFENLFND